MKPRTDLPWSTLLVAITFGAALWAGVWLLARALGLEPWTVLVGVALLGLGVAIARAGGEE